MIDKTFTYFYTIITNVVFKIQTIVSSALFLFLYTSVFSVFKTSLNEDNYLVNDADEPEFTLEFLVYFTLPRFIPWR